MAKKQNSSRPVPSRSGDGAVMGEGADVPVVGLREPCPCGSGRRYKACHGRGLADAGQTLVHRPFEGLESEGDWVALREIVPAATAPLTLGPEYAARLAGRTVTLATVLPMALPAIVRQDGQILLGLQTTTGSGDTSRDIAESLLRALDSEPGSQVPSTRAGDGPRLQDLLAPGALEVRVHAGFDFWLEGTGTESTPDVVASLERANSSVVPTERLSGVPAAYWCRIGPKEHLRWVQPYAEEPLLDALARMHARGQDGLGDGTRLIGTFRAHGLLVPVWDLVTGTEVAAVEEQAREFAIRLEAAMGESGALTESERRARAGLTNRQVTLR